MRRGFFQNVGRVADKKTLPHPNANDAAQPVPDQSLEQVAAAQQDLLSQSIPAAAIGLNRKRIMQMSTFRMKGDFMEFKAGGDLTIVCGELQPSKLYFKDEHFCTVMIFRHGPLAVFSVTSAHGSPCVLERDGKLKSPEQYGIVMHEEPCVVA